METRENQGWGCWNLKDSHINPELEIGALEIIRPFRREGVVGFFMGEKPDLNTIDRKLYDTMHESYRNSGNSQWWNSPLSQIDRRSILHVGLYSEVPATLEQVGYSKTLLEKDKSDPEFFFNRTARLFQVGEYNFHILQQVINLGEEVKLTEYEKNFDDFKFSVYRPVSSTEERYERFS